MSGRFHYQRSEEGLRGFLPGDPRAGLQERLRHRDCRGQRRREDHADEMHDRRYRRGRRRDRSRERPPCRSRVRRVSFPAGPEVEAALLHILEHVRRLGRLRLPEDAEGFRNRREQEGQGILQRDEDEGAGRCRAVPPHGDPGPGRAYRGNGSCGQGGVPGSCQGLHGGRVALRCDLVPHNL